MLNLSWENAVLPTNSVFVQFHKISTKANSPSCHEAAQTEQVFLSASYPSFTLYFSREGCGKWASTSDRVPASISSSPEWDLNIFINPHLELKILFIAYGSHQVEKWNIDKA